MYMMHRDALLAAARRANPWWADPLARRARDYPARRDGFDRISTHLASEQRRALVVVGPRQIGKSVLLLQTADALLDAQVPPANVVYFDFHDPLFPEEATAGDLLDAVPAPRPGVPRFLLLDEVTKMARWDRWLGRLVDDGGLRTVATDSAASILRDEGRDSMLGRWDELRLEGLSLCEFARFQRPGRDAQEVMHAAPSTLERYLLLGGFPEHALSESVDQVHRRLRQDVVDRAIGADLAGRGLDTGRLKRLFAHLMEEPGGILSASERARDLAADRRSVAEWVGALEEAALVVTVPRIASHASARLRSSGRPKVYPIDHGLVSAFALDPEDARARGALRETVVLRHLREIIAPPARLAYFRLRDEIEIDFVLDGGGARLAIEVTSSREPARRLERLRLAARAARARRVLLVHGGASNEEMAGVELVSLDRFLLDPARVVAGGGA
jgi:predicted AAA+ superfamily ATPase